MAKIQYKIIVVHDKDDVEEKTLNELGNDGWELVSVNYSPLEKQTIFYLRK